MPCKNTSWMLDDRGIERNPEGLDRNGFYTCPECDYPTRRKPPECDNPGCRVNLSAEQIEYYERLKREEAERARIRKIRADYWKRVRKK